MDSQTNKFEPHSRLRGIVQFAITRPKMVIGVVLAITIVFACQLPKMVADTNPKHMLPPTSNVRVWNDEVEKIFGLYEDMIVVGIVNEKGILNKETLGKIIRITSEIVRIKGVAARDVNSFSTITNVTAEGKILKVAPLVQDVPKNAEEMNSLKKMLYENPLFLERIISKDGKTTAIYIPLEKGSNGKDIADRIREIVKREGGPEQYHIAGDPVARDTFGAEMFRLMGFFSPVAGLIMALALWFMFHSVCLLVANMAVAMISIIWSIGLLVWLGFPIHIMSSMSPIFLMAIATDSIHIFNEFDFRYREKKNKKTAIIETMEVVGRPVRYTALATAAAFLVLIFMHNIPFRVFGGLVAFGTIILRFLSFSFIPAMFTFAKEETIGKDSRDEDVSSNLSSRFLKKLAGLGVRKPITTVLVGFAFLVVAIIGTTKIVVNNNIVNWFKKSSEVRVSDTVMNQALGGTSLGYIVAFSKKNDFVKTPEAMRYIEGLQRHLEKLSIVGKTLSVVDYVKRIHRVLHDDDQKYDVVPDSKEIIGQYLFLFSMSAKPSDLDNVVDSSFQTANVWVQLKTWDAQAMGEVINAVDSYKMSHPTRMEFKPSGIAYFNFVWNNEVLYDTIKGFILALIVVFIILAFNFHSVKWAIVGYTPLLFTILLIYGAIGFSGRDFDLPMATLSCLSLGMAVDFAIHFISRFKQHLGEDADPIAQSLESGEAKKHFTYHSSAITESLLWTAARPGKGIMRNALLFAGAFSVMIFAPLVPYITVGMFVVSMMILSSLLTMIYVPALIILMKGWLFKGG